MRKYLFIGFGGFLGAVLRYAVKKVVHYEGGIPLNTLLVNITGCFLLAFLLSAAFSFLKLEEDVRLGLSTGLLGAFTTFSTLCRETVQLLQSGMYLASFTYIVLTVILGFGAAYLGFLTAGKVGDLMSGVNIEDYGAADNNDGEAR